MTTEEFDFEPTPDPPRKPEQTHCKNNNPSSALPASALFREALKQGFLTVSEASEILKQLMETQEGASCPCCGQLVKTYRRKIHSQMARCLILFFRKFERDFTTSEGVFHSWPDFVREQNLSPHQTADFAKLAYWGLIEKETGIREDGSGRVGFWRVTDYGKQFIHSGVGAYQYAIVFNGKRIRFEGGCVTIHHCLGEKFNYAELMGSR